MEITFGCYLVEPFPATLHNDFDVFLHTVVFAHKNSNAIFPIPLEQCWTAWWMRENTHIVIKYRQQGSNLLDKLHEHKWFDGSLLQENLQLQRDNQKLQKMPWLMPLKWNNKLNYGKDSAMATRAQGSRIISIQTHALNISKAIRRFSPSRLHNSDCQQDACDAPAPRCDLGREIPRWAAIFIF